MGFNQFAPVRNNLFLQFFPRTGYWLKSGVLNFAPWTPFTYIVFVTKSRLIELYYSIWWKLLEIFFQ